MAGNRDFDKEQFKELVRYIAWKTQSDQSFGRTKLAKVLFYCDLSVYAEEGAALTGAVYQHWQFGPFPPALYEIEEELAAEGGAEVTEQAAGEHKLRVAERPTMSRFEAWENWQRQVVDKWIGRIGAGGAWKASDDSHKHPGWLLTDMYEEIPYHTAFMSRRQPSVNDRARGEALAIEHGWP